MKQSLLNEFAAIPQPEKGQQQFIDALKAEKREYFSEKEKCCGVSVCIEGAELIPETALVSLRRVFKAKGISEAADGVKIIFRSEPSWEHEEFEVNTSENGAEIVASDSDGMRRAVYFLEDRIREMAAKLFTYGSWHRKAEVKIRISRCFFGPTVRPPFFIDELTNDIDYYPEEYLNKLAHEGINGLWLTMYFFDMPSTVFKDHGKDAPKRFAKLQRTVDKCAKYGIKIYVFFSEPKFFADNFKPHAYPLDSAKDHPELRKENNRFCTSTEAGKRFIRESVEALFSNVHGLGGCINIMYGEDNGTCPGVSPSAIKYQCPECTRRGAPAVYREQAEIFYQAMKKYSPESEFIGWFYAPGSRDGSKSSQFLAGIEEAWPEECFFMLNFESGGMAEQLGKVRTVFDYSLAYVGPCQQYVDMTERCKGRKAAKLQVGCSHEDASVPFIPVPSNLYEKYKFLQGHQVTAAMQCWYFGNYPGLMNKAAGELSFSPFPESEQEFLQFLAAPDWRENSAVVAEAWSHFSTAYRLFPMNICFEWYGLLHHSIAWPWHLFPADAPLAPSWLIHQFPEISGDRIGEALGFHHNLADGIELCRQMDEEWSKGSTLLEKLLSGYQENPDRLEDIGVALAVGLQIKSALNTLRFYEARERMFRTGISELEEMKKLVRDEIVYTQRMKELCLKDPRLGYHSEAEAFLFHPERLTKRAELLQVLLDEDFPAFSLDAPFIKRWTGAEPDGLIAHAGETYPVGNTGSSWRISREGDKMIIELLNRKEGLSYTVYIEPRRLWTAFTATFDRSGADTIFYFICREVPEVVFNNSMENGRIELPLALFEEFREPGLPMRVNVRAMDKDGNAEYWGGNHPWKSRLTHEKYNPADSGWLLGI
ncbi:MAG: hypothetical protein IKA87_08235 [Lentisphaeria bacterium]|nr:hypothetical protein [Lentisphaeria bacterium]